jgi:hypothetical protein
MSDDLVRYIREEVHLGGGDVFHRYVENEEGNVVFYSQASVVLTAKTAEITRLRAELATARRDGMEDCAKWHDAVAAEYKREQAIYEARDSWTVAYVFAQGAVINKNRAAAIRAAAGEVN